MYEVILINLINHQDYIQYNIKQLQLLGYNITIITDKELVGHFNDSVNIVITDQFNIDMFDKKTKMDNAFRGGFWKLASKRLFYLYEYMKQYNKTNCIHIENDVLLYQKINIPDVTKLWITMDSPKRCIPGIMFVPNYTILTQFIEQYDYNKNDMENLALFYIKHHHSCKTFPIIKKNSHYNKTDIYNESFNNISMIFDAAAIGQYLGGVDPRNKNGDTRGFINETCVIDYSNYSFIWIYDTATTLYLPYIKVDNDYVPIANLHIHSKQLHKFLSSFPEENSYLIPLIYPYTQNEIITGEKLQERCIAYCGTESSFKYNPRIKKQSQKHINLELIKEPFNNPTLLFCYSNNLSMLLSKLNFFDNPFVLVSHNSDENITNKYAQLISSNKIIALYSQNKLIDHPKVKFLPIGIANSMWPHGNLDRLFHFITNPGLKKNDFYFYFNCGTNPLARNDCKNKLIKKGLPFGKQIDYSNYLKLLSSYKFAICPDGNGVDSHRIWECYYLSVIPILKHSLFSIEISRHLPCIILNDWTDFDHRTIVKEYPQLLRQLSQNYHKLNVSYYALQFVDIKN